MVAMAASVTSIFINSLWGRGAYFFEAVKGVGHQVGKRPDIAEGEPLADVEWVVPNMVCEGCAEKISAALGPIAGVREVKPKVSRKRVLIRYEPAKVREQELKEALGQAGFNGVKAVREA
jgi:copper chaperone CopZ